MDGLAYAFRKTHTGDIGKQKYEKLFLKYVNGQRYYSAGTTRRYPRESGVGVQSVYPSVEVARSFGIRYSDRHTDGPIVYARSCGIKSFRSHFSSLDIAVAYFSAIDAA